MTHVYGNHDRVQSKLKFLQKWRLKCFPDISQHEKRKEMAAHQSTTESRLSDPGHENGGGGEAEDGKADVELCRSSSKSGAERARTVPIVPPGVFSQ
jgi:hypothetical protein